MNEEDDSMEGLGFAQAAAKAIGKRSNATEIRRVLPGIRFWRFSATMFFGGTRLAKAHQEPLKSQNPVQIRSIPPTKRALHSQAERPPVFGWSCLVRR
jgi:hypothetical protein